MIHLINIHWASAGCQAMFLAQGTQQQTKQTKFSALLQNLVLEGKVDSKEVKQIGSGK